MRTKQGRRVYCGIERLTKLAGSIMYLDMFYNSPKITEEEIDEACEMVKIDNSFSQLTTVINQSKHQMIITRGNYRGIYDLDTKEQMLKALECEKLLLSKTE
jgi:hypothetical protein